ELATLLDVDITAPVLKMILTAYTADNEVVNLAHVYYRSDRYNHHGYLRRRRSKDDFGWTPVERIHPVGS
ncbi:MAG: UTRA domain-containing protein, partial [Thermoleophilia bacterium]|nr:UTRA domain-containing protein [Thermoleophilia bacterium]